MFFSRRRRPTFVDSSHKYPTIHTKPDQYTCAADCKWTYMHVCHSHCAPIPFGTLVHLEDHSVCYQRYTGRISEVVAQYENVLIVNVVLLHYEKTDPYAPPPVRLTLPTGIITLPKRLRFVRWYKKHTKRLTKSKAADPAMLMQSMKELMEYFEGSESFGNSVDELGGEILVRSSQDRRYDDLLRHVRSLGPLSECSLTHTSISSATT
jgi:hypothetical protein